MRILSALIIVSSFTKNMSQKIIITILLNINGIILYYIHKRIWNGIEDKKVYFGWKK